MKNRDMFEDALGQIREGELESEKATPDLELVKNHLESSELFLAEALEYRMVPDLSALEDLRRRQGQLRDWLHT